MNNSKSLVVKGLFWSSVQLVVNTSFTFIIRLVLAKILFPEEFGLVGMATVLTGFIKVLNDLGIGAALVQRKDEELRREHFHTAFWTGVGWSVFLFLIMSFIVGPRAASFYEEPILKSLIPVLSLGILSSPVNLVHKAQLMRNMDFKKIAFIDNTANFVTGIIAIILAFWGAGVWSLVFNSVVSIVIAMPLYFRATKWYPSFIWDRLAFKQVFGFGVFTTGTSVVNYIIGNIDYLVIGKLISAEALGAYTFAFILTDTFRSRLMTVVNNVMYPVYGKKQSDPSSLKNYYLKIVNYNSVIIFPLMSCFIILGEPIVINIFGEKWSDSVMPLKLLSLSVMVHMMVNSNTSLIRGIGKPGLELKLQIFKAVIFVPMLIVGIYKYGIIGAATAVLINKVIAVIIAQYTFNKLIDIKISTTEFLSAIKVPWIASLFCILLAYCSYNLLGFHYIVAAGILVLSYAITIWLFMGKEIKAQIQ